jgi:hypothetical protein
VGAVLLDDCRLALAENCHGSSNSVPLRIVRG